jgi:hypothetical protein
MRKFLEEKERRDREIFRATQRGMEGADVADSDEEDEEVRPQPTMHSISTPLTLRLRSLRSRRRWTRRSSRTTARS